MFIMRSDAAIANIMSPWKNTGVNFCGWNQLNDDFTETSWREYFAIANITIFRPSVAFVLPLHDDINSVGSFLFALVLWKVISLVVYLGSSKLKHLFASLWKLFSSPCFHHFDGRLYGFLRRKTVGESLYNFVQRVKIAFLVACCMLFGSEEENDEKQF